MLSLHSAITFGFQRDNLLIPADQAVRFGHGDDPDPNHTHEADHPPTPKAPGRPIKQRALDAWHVLEGRLLQLRDSIRDKRG